MRKMFEKKNYTVVTLSLNIAQILKRTNPKKP